MSSVREQALQAIVARLEAAGTFAVVRNADTPVTVDATGCVVVRDGDRISAEPTLGAPASWWITHRADVEVLAAGADRENGLDALIETVDATLTADRSLGGVVHWLETSVEQIETLAAEGADAQKAALIGVTLEYESGQATG
jgi:hypothetical protein